MIMAPTDMEETLEQSCVFCNIIAHDAPATFVYEDEQVVAIKDINPQAPVHVVLIPREHNLESLNDMSKLDVSLMGHLLYVAAKVANQLDIAESGYGRPVSLRSNRAGANPGTHEIGFDSAEDTITIRHQARSGDGFARGALRAARWLADKQGFYEFREIADRLS